MSSYFLVHDASFFHDQLLPALGDSRRQARFAPCLQLCESLMPQAIDFTKRFQVNLEESLIVAVQAGLPFDRAIWRALVGELLFLAAVEIPELQIAPATLTCLMAPEQFKMADLPRNEFAPIQQAIFGSRELSLGGRIYQAEHLGWNDVADVKRLANHLSGIDPSAWNESELSRLTDLLPDERADELEYNRYWFPLFRDVYKRSAELNQVVVCEEIRPTGIP